MDATIQAAPVSYRWYEVWQKMYLHASIKTIQDLLAAPSANPDKAALWIIITAALAGIVRGLGIADGGIGLIMGALVLPILAALALALLAALFHGMARALGGSGTPGSGTLGSGTLPQLFYCLGAIQGPYMVARILLDLSKLAIIVTAGTDLEAVSMMLLMFFTAANVGVGIYTLVLYVASVQAVENLPAGKAAVAVFVPLTALVMLYGLCSFLSASQAAPNFLP